MISGGVEEVGREVEGVFVREGALGEGRE